MGVSSISTVRMISSFLSGFRLKHSVGVMTLRSRFRRNFSRLAAISPGQKSKAAEQPQKKRSPGRKGCGRGWLRTVRKKMESGYEQ